MADIDKSARKTVDKIKGQASDVHKKILKERSKGLVALTACLGGEVTSACFRGDMDHARRAANECESTTPSLVRIPRR